MIGNLIKALTAYHTFRKLNKLGLVRKSYKFLEIYKCIKDNKSIIDEVMKNETSESTETTIQ